MKTKQRLTPISNKQTEAKAEVIKLGIDIHQHKYVVVAQTDNGAAKWGQSKIS